MTDQPSPGDLRVWWIPQVPMTAFYVPVRSVEEGAKILNVLAAYDLFQFRHRVKPDYSNVGGLQVFDATDTTDAPNGSWSDWCDEESGETDPVAYIRELTGMP